MPDFSSVAEIARRQHGVLTSEQLARAGWNAGQVAYQVKKGTLVRCDRGVVVIAGSQASWQQRVAAAALAAHPIGGAASHRSAAQIWNFRSVDDEVEVAIPYPRRLTLRNAVVHRSVDLTGSDITWCDAIPVTTPERTLCDLGLVFPESEVMRILRHAVATGLVNRADVRRMRIRIGRPGRNGAGHIGRCLDQLADLTEATESGLESMFLEFCEQFDLPMPEVQLPVVAAGRRYRLDFAYATHRVFVEIDGAEVHSLPHQIAADGGRQNDLVAAGWTPIRLTYAMLTCDPGRCAETLRQVLTF